MPQHRVIGEVMRANPFRRQQEVPPEPPPQSHLTVLDDDPPFSSSQWDYNDSAVDPDPIRYVIIADKVFGVRPETVYRGILADGSDYFPYYDDNLTTATTDDINHHIYTLIERIRRYSD